MPRFGEWHQDYRHEGGQRNSSTSFTAGNLYFCVVRKLYQMVSRQTNKKILVSQMHILRLNTAVFAILHNVVWNKFRSTRDTDDGTVACFSTLFIF